MKNLSAYTLAMLKSHNSPNLHNAILSVPHKHTKAPCHSAIFIPAKDMHSILIFIVKILI